MSTYVTPPTDAPLLPTLTCAGGTITTLVSPENLPLLLQLAKDLSVSLVEMHVPVDPEVAETSAGNMQDVERKRKGLEDLFTLM